MVETGRALALAAALLATLGAAAQPGGRAESDPRLLRDTRDALVRAEDFSAALDPAERLVARAEDEQPATAIRDLLSLARIQTELDRFADAELNYLEAIDLLRDAEGEFAETLVPAYRALGNAYLDNREFTRAISALEQGRHVSQRNSGLYNLEQSALIDDLTVAHLGLGNTVAARELQIERLNNALRQFGGRDPRTVPFRFHLADYYERSRLRSSAREQYEKSLGVLESAHGELDPRLLPPLRALLRNDFALGDLEAAKEHAGRIERILETGAALPARERSESLAALGDWSLVRGVPRESEGYYARAYEELESEDPAAAADAFGTPRLLDFVAPLSAVDRNVRNRPYAWGTVEVELDVSADGRAVGVDIVAVEPAARAGADFAQRLRETHFRPRLTDGVPAATHGVRFSHDFRYYVDRDDD